MKKNGGKNFVARLFVTTRKKGQMKTRSSYQVEITVDVPVKVRADIISGGPGSRRIIFGATSSESMEDAENALIDAIDELYEKAHSG